MSKRKIQDNTKISAIVDVSEWRERRKMLVSSICSGNSDEQAWKSAFTLFDTRVKTRFVNPIRWILDKGEDVGEGFSVVALQCILIEFIEAFYQGKVYTTSKDPRGFEYNSSGPLFRDFLMGHKPFSEIFTQKKSAEGFYNNIRCGLLHEAATKETSRIKTSRIDNSRSHGRLVDFEPDDPSNMRVYRENLQKAICGFIAEYGKELLSDQKLQENFIRKMDDICGIGHCYFFAYGSYMDPTTLRQRIDKYHTAFRAILPDYRFTYNMKSSDNPGMAKANVEESDRDAVKGVCFEIDDDDLSVLQQHERGYDRRNIKVKTEDGREEIAVTFVSASVDNTLMPSAEYKNIVRTGASYWGLDTSYVDEWIA